MPLASEPKHSKTSLFFTHFSWSTGDFWVAAAAEDNKPSFCLPKNIVRLFPCFIGQGNKHVAQGFTAARELRLLGNTGRHEMTVHPLQPQVKAQNLVCVNKVTCGAAEATNPGRCPDAAWNNVGSKTRSAVSNNGHYAPREQWHLLTLGTEEMDETLRQPRTDGGVLL